MFKQMTIILKIWFVKKLKQKLVTNLTYKNPFEFTL